MPANWERSSETGWAKRERLATQRTISGCEPSSSIVVADVGEDFAVLRVEELERAAAEDLEELAQGDHVARPVQERGLIG